jgi:N-acetylglutamate synthase-like GNAT family acetyltransferase
MSEPADVAIRIRAAELSDAVVLANLMSQLGYSTRTSEMEMRLKTILPDRRYQTWVAVREGKVAGMIGTFCYQGYEHNNPSAKILALVVDEAMRSVGVGKALIAAAEADLANQNITRLIVNTRLTREDAHAFYERVGYEKNGFRFVKTLRPEID